MTVVHAVNVSTTLGTRDGRCVELRETAMQYIFVYMYMFFFKFRNYFCKAASNVGPYGLFWQPALVCYSSILYLCLLIGQIKMLACSSTECFKKVAPAKTFWNIFTSAVFLREIMHILLAVHIHIHLPIFVDLS